MAGLLVVDLEQRSAQLSQVEWDPDGGPLSLVLARQQLQRGDKPFVVVGRGPLAGYPVVGAQVATVTAISPVFPVVTEAKVEGPLAGALLSLGLAAMVIRGVANQPTTVTVTEDEDVAVSFDDATDYRDRSVFDTDAELRDVPDDVVMCTGEWGMKAHPAASIVTNCGFPTSQGGLGGVFGQLGLKAVVFRPGGNLPVATPTEQRITQGYAARIDANPLAASERDYPGFGLWPSEGALGYAGSGGFSGEPTEGLIGFDSASLMEFARDDGSAACPGCPQSCLKSFSTDPSHPVDGGRVHQLGIAALASQSGVSSPEQLVDFNSLCHDWGVEHLAAEEAWRQSSDEGLSLPERLRTALIAHPLGSGLDQRVKGMPIPPFDPRTNQGLGVGYALNPTGPRYDVLEHDIDFDPAGVGPERSEVGREYHIPPGGLPMGTLDSRRDASIVSLWLLWSGLDALGMCEYAAPPTRELAVDDVVDLANQRLGRTVSREDLEWWGKVRLGLLRDINARIGPGGQADVLPGVFFDTPLPAGTWHGSVIDRDDFERACQYVRGQFGWDSVGVDKTSPVARALDDIDSRWDQQRLEAGV